MSCEVCRGYSCACPCCGPEDDDESPSSCGGDGVAAGCEGCEDCVKEVRRTTYHTARKAHHGLRVGDIYARTTGFDYQVGGGRTGYVRPTVRCMLRGPNHPAVLVETGVVPLPPVAQERAALTARYAEVSTRLGDWFNVRWFTVEEADALVAQARVVSAEVEAFIALHDAGGKLGLRALMRAGGAGTLVARAERHAVEARKREEARKVEEARKALAAEWQASGGAYKAAGERVTFAGREYVLGPVGSRWIAHSNMEYMGHSVDGEVVTGRSLLCPETGKALLRWTDKRDYPVPA